ncbi:MAG: hypothetical protein JJ855_09260 [Rhodospirillales bacterium]|nr:hypothetical protein [Rhodospirillales bacterium]
MTGLHFIIGGISIFIAGEILLHGLVRWLRSTCPWLITQADEHPKLDADGLRSFIRHGWDPELGWVRKPDTSGEDVGRDGAAAVYRIDATGARHNPGFSERDPEILVYGDSYAFSRQVGDAEAWPHLLSRQLERHVANYGVGNYGLDQALLRLEREFADHPANLVIMAVVPETMSRIHAYWKHYSEYGNTFAFKPRFVLEQGALRLLPNMVDTPEAFDRLRQFLPQLRKHDGFYATKFRRDLLTFPYLASAFKNPARTFGLIARALSDRLGLTEDAAFMQVMRRNMTLNRQLYADQKATDLFAAIAERFATFCRSNGAQPVFVFLPQRIDLEFMRDGSHYYAPMVKRLSRSMIVVDAGPALLKNDPDTSLFINDRFGGHYSPVGNRIVADLVRSMCKDILVDDSTTSDVDK